MDNQIKTGGVTGAHLYNAEHGGAREHQHAAEVQRAAGGFEVAQHVRSDLLLVLAALGDEEDPGYGRPRACLVQETVPLGHTLPFGHASCKFDRQWAGNMGRICVPQGLGAFGMGKQ